MLIRVPNVAIIFVLAIILAGCTSADIQGLPPPLDYSSSSADDYSYSSSSSHSSSSSLSLVSSSSSVYIASSSSSNNLPQGYTGWCTINSLCQEVSESVCNFLEGTPCQNPLWR